MMFRPRESHDQRLLSHELTITPTPVRQRALQDVFGNSVSVATFSGRTTELVFDSLVRLEHTPVTAFEDLGGEVGAYTGAAHFDYAPEDLPDLRSSMAREHADLGGVVAEWARSFVRPVGKTSLQALLSDMTQAIYADFKYRKRLIAGVQTPVETLALRSGACRDYAVLMIDAVRSLGLAARFVSGYIYSPYAGADRGRIGSGHTHAWVRVYLPACGWVEFDPTNGIVGNTDLVRVAVARDPSQAVPLHGSWFGGAGDYLGMEVEVDVSSENDHMAQPARPLRVVGSAV